MVTRRRARVHDEPAYVLHHHAWSESSAILEVFSRHHGRVVLVGKGVKRPTSQYRAVLLPLLPLRLDWSGEAEVRTLKAAQYAGGQVLPTGEALLAGYYLNELLLRLLMRDDPHPALFDHYAAAVAALVWPEQRVVALRAFELLLLRTLGWLPDLGQEGVRLLPLQPNHGYRLHPDAGLLPAADIDTAALRGGHWQRLQRALQAADAWSALLRCADVLTQPALRQGLAALLHYHSGMTRFRTHAMLLAVRRLAALGQPGASAPSPGTQS